MSLFKCETSVISFLQSTVIVNVIQYLSLTKYSQQTQLPLRQYGTAPLIPYVADVPMPAIEAFSELRGLVQQLWKTLTAQPEDLDAPIASRTFLYHRLISLFYSVEFLTVARIPYQRTK